MSLATPVLAWLASLLATTATSQSGSLTVTVNITQGWEIQIPIAVSWKSAVSADAIVNAYPSSDGGATYDNNPAFSIAIPRQAGGVRSMASIKLPTGQYALQILNSGPSTGSAQIVTAQIITALQIV